MQKWFREAEHQQSQASDKKIMSLQRRSHTLKWK